METNTRRETKERRFGFRLKPSLDERFREFTKESGEAMNVLVERAIEGLMANEGPSQADISFDLSEHDREELKKLADACYFDDVNLFAKSLTRAALDNGPDVARQLLYGKLDAAVDVRIEAEKQELAALQKKPQRAKKAA